MRSEQQGFVATPRRAARTVLAVSVSMAIVVVLALTVFVGMASASGPAPGWEVTSRAYPTHLKPGGKGVVIVEVYNTGAGSTNGTVTVTDTLPPGLEATQSGAMLPFGKISNEGAEYYEEEDEIGEKKEAEGKAGGGPVQQRVWDCSGTTVVTCTTGPGFKGIQRPIKPGYVGRIGIDVNVVGAPGAGANKVVMSGGGASSAAEASNPFTISSEAPGFGITGSGFDGWLTNADGTPDTQAGSHPFELTLSFALNSGKEDTAGGAPRDLEIALPPGFVGDPHAAPQCPRQQYIGLFSEHCPPDTQVGVDVPGILSRETEAEEGYGELSSRIPVYNLVPPPGVAAEFAFSFAGHNYMIDATVRSGSDYGITGSVHNLTLRPVFNSLTLWGAPEEAVHDPDRCGSTGVGEECGLSIGNVVPKPLLTVPTSCEGPLTTRISLDAWDPNVPASTASFTFHDPTGKPVGFSGCEHLGFNTFLSVAPDTSFADTPAGLTVDLKVPQEGLKAVGSLATSDIKDTTVTLPEGVAINPGQAAGLSACGPGEDGLTTEAEKAEGKEDDGPAHCPNAARVGTDEIETPLLAKPLKGAVYVMPSDPPHIQLLVTAEGEGVFLKLVGDVHLNEQTGQLTTTFTNTPEVPFTDFKLAFSGGAQAALSTPPRCGTYNTTSRLHAVERPGGRRRCSPRATSRSRLAPVERRVRRASCRSLRR